MSKPIKEWKSIFVDTGIIIDYCKDPNRFEKNEQEKKRILTVHSLFDYFDKRKENGYNWKLYISAITISELTKGKSNYSIEELIELFNNPETTIINYSYKIAKNTLKKISEEDPNSIKLFKDLVNTLKNENSSINARKWISDDLKIAMSALSLNSQIDAVLTNDRKTFLPIAKFLGINVISVEDIPLDLFGNIEAGVPIVLRP